MGTLNGIPLWILLVTLAPFLTQGQFGASDYPSHDTESFDYDLGQSVQQPQQSEEIISGGQRLTLIKSASKLPVKAINVAHNNRVCSTWGNFHYKNFDGDIFHFPGTCNYVFSSHCKSSYEDFHIQIRRTNRVIEKISLKLDGLPVVLSPGSIIVGDKQVQLPYSGSGVQIDNHGGPITIVSKLGLTLIWHDDDSLLLELDSKYANATCGLCGDFNGIPTYNEFVANDVLLTATQFGNLQKMDGPTEQCQDATPDTLNNCLDHEGTCITILMSEAFFNCHLLVAVEPYITACIQDLCQCDSQVLGQCMCDTVSEYSRQCTHAGGQPTNWRTGDLCPKSCPNNMVYQECGSPCQDTCSNSERSAVCENHCREGCFCPPGTVFDDITKSGCVPVSQCPCTFNKKTYAAGSTYTSLCFTCACTDGKWQCVNVPCSGRCSIEGGSHITTYDNTHYSIHGDCNYVLSKSCDGDSFIVLAEMRKCGLTETETCLKSSTIILNKDTVIVIKPCGSVFVNSIYTQLPVSAANVTIFRPTSFYIIVQTNLGVQISVQLIPFMQIYVAVEPAYKGLTCGLCGNFNDKQSDDFLTMSGVIEGTAASFANTWKTLGTCTNIKNVHEDPCALSVENEQYAKHWCGLLSDELGPFAACHAVVNPENYQQNCMFDTCNCEKSEDCMCAALSSYVHACAVKGILLAEWRSTVCTKFMNNCPKSLTYTYSTDTCQPTCRSLSEPDVTCSIKFDPVDGCTCAKDFYMDDTGKCIPAAACPCYYKGSAVPSGEVVHDNGMMCTCTQGKLTCIGNIEPACQAPMVYFDCTNATADTKGSECQKSCQTLDMACYSTKCVSGCVCPAGLIADGNGGCIKEDDCPCVHNDATYKPGEQIKMKCNTCTCKDRMWQCTTNPCLETCAVYGDGHYVTFDGKRYSFNGDCEYVLSQDHCGKAEDSSSTFRVITENIPCGTTGTTCSKSIKVFLGNYELILTEENIELVQKGDGGALPYTVRSQGIYVVIEADNGLILMWDKKTSIFIKISKNFEGKVCGLCGNFDGDGNNDFTTRSQSVVEDVAEFANSWKVSNSCPDAKTPKDACLANPYRKSWAQKQCSILNSRTFSACHSLVDPAKYYDACVSDSCACDTGGDCECFCTAVAAYAQVCGESGICVSWRTPSICPLFCDYFNPEGECDWHYKPCGSPCMKTCRNPTGKCIQELSGLEGCYPTCPAGTFFDEDELKCVDRCGCYDDTGKHFKIGESMPSKENCHKCECTLSGVDCKYEKEACHCEYKGKLYPYKHTIYNTTDGIGGCITAVCNDNGEITRDIYPCPFTTTPIFTFTTTHLPSTKGTTTATTVCRKKECTWSKWIDASYPKDNIQDGDFDTYQNIRAKGISICEAPEDIECRAERFPDTPLSELEQKVQCNKTFGLICYNKDQLPPICYNYEIRVKCCSLVPCTVETPSTTKTPETTTKHQETTKPTTHSTTKSTPASTTSSEPTTVKIPETTTKHQETSKPTTHSTTKSTPASTTTVKTPESTTKHQETTKQTTHSTTKSTPIVVPTTHSVSTEAITNVPTTACLPKCKWSHWIDLSIPSIDNGGDIETFDKIKAAGHRICPVPYEIECRAEKYPLVPIHDIKQVVQCDVTVGLVCHNEDQLGPLKLCLNYQIKVLCCDDYSHCKGETTAAATTVTVPETTIKPTTEPIIIETVTQPKPSTAKQVVPTTQPPACQPRCKWSPWYDVDHPSSGIGGGDHETYENLRKAGKKICQTPSDVQCRAVNYPGVNIEKLGQDVECNVQYGLVCKNEEKGDVTEMCYNYEIRVQCCDDYSHCEATTAPTPTTKPATTTQCFCHIDNKLFKPGETIYEKTDDAGCIFIAVCDKSCEIERNKGPCIETTLIPQTTPKPSTAKPSTLKPQITTVTVAHTTTEEGCAHRKVNETWVNDKCEEVTCHGNGITTHKAMTCPELTPLTCANGFPSVKTKDADGCCEHYECQCVCSGWGDPHYITFDGVYYNFLDNCTYVLVQEITPKYDGFRILIDNYFCDAEDGLSCPQSIIIYYESNEVVLTRMMYKGRMANRIRFNNNWVTPGFTKDGIIISNLGINMQVEIPALDAFISFSGLIFYIKLPFSKFSYNTEGQCGTCTNSSADGCRMPDGQIVKDCGKMAPHWRVNSTQPGCDHHVPLQPTPPSPPTTCPPSSLCKIILGDVFAPCHKVIDPKHYYDGCVFDDCKVKGEEIPCSSLQVYAEICSQNGVCIDWRSKTGGLCPSDCPKGMEYKACGPVNVETCDIARKTDITIINQTEGCYCPEGTIRFNGNSEECVKICGCSDQGKAKEPGERWTSGCSSCVCEPNSLTTQCEPLLCSPLPPLKCDKDGFIPVTINDPDNPCCPGQECRCNSTFCIKEQEKTCPVGFKYELSPEFLKGETCCPKYICTPLQVCVVDDKIYPPGSSVPSSTADLCQDCHCSDEKDANTDLYKVKCEVIPCHSICDEGFQYQEDGNNCCGECVQVECAMKENDKIILIKPGETWTSPKDKCTTYECKETDDHLVISSKTTDCSVTSQKDCPQGYTYEKVDGECCGHCKQVACIMKLKDDKTQILQPNEQWKSPDEPCVVYVCEETDGHFSFKEVHATCRVEKCGLGYESKKIEGECCDKCIMVACVLIPTDKSAPIVIQPGQTWTSTKDKCTTYECKEESADHFVLTSKTKDCSVLSNADCGPGFEYIKEEGACCGHCLQTSCPVKMKDNTVEVLQPGDTWSPPGEPCVIYSCEDTKGSLSTKENSVKCPEETCEAGFEFMKVEGECCGKCVQVTCIMTPEDKSTPITIKPGETWTSPKDKCTTYECKETDDHLVISSKTTDCSVTSQKDCPQGYTYEKVDGECCGHCKQVACIMKLKDDKTQILQPNEQWKSPDEPCVVYVCEETDGHFSFKEVHATCRVEKCGLGYESKKIEGECCDKCIMVACVLIPTDKSAPIVIQPGQTWTSPKDKCITYECKEESEGHFVTSSIVKECSVTSKQDCTQGFEYQKDAGECCGHCEQVACTVNMKDNTIKTLKPGDKLDVPDEKCKQYECEIIDGHFINVEVRRACPIEDCEDGYKFEKVEGECCGKCVQISCVMPMPDKTIKTFTPGETWTSTEDKCTTYECKEESVGHLVISSTTKGCSVTSEKDCLEGFKYKKEEGECCGQCIQVACVMKLKDNADKVLQPGEPWTSPEDKCMTYVCKETSDDHFVISSNARACAVISEKDCGEGYKYEKVEGECCGQCIQVACVMKLKDHTDKVLQPSETWTSTEDKCTTYECKEESVGHLVISSTTKDCSVTSDKDCLEGYKYNKVEGECCGQCIQVACVMKLKDNTDKVLQPGETWTSTEDKCTTYECKEESGHLVISSTTKDCSVTSDKDCPEGFKYKKVEAECCGQCIQVACVMKLKDNADKVLQPGETWISPEDKCMTYECTETSDDHFVVSSKARACAVIGEKDCGEGYKYEKVEGECCGQCIQVACVMKLKDNTDKILKPGEPWISPEDKCITYECKETSDDHFVISSKAKECSVTSEKNCGEGYKYEKEEGECCGQCVQVACVMKLKDNTDKVLKTGETWTSTEDKCTTYECKEESVGHLVISSTTKDCSVTSEKDCPEAFKYKKVEGECCGQCVQVACVMKLKDHTDKVLQIGETFSPPGEPCLSYECEKYEDQPILTHIKRACPIEDCEPGFTYQKAEEGECCGKCEKVACVVNDVTPPVILQPGDVYSQPDDKCLSYKCSNKFDLVKETKTCPAFNPEDCVERTIHTTDDGCCKNCTLNVNRCQAHKTTEKIRSGLCVSEPVEISSCGGGCMTSSIYSADSNSMEHKCSCCQEKKTSKKEVTLQCPDGTSKVYTYVSVEECGCTTTECDTGSQLSHEHHVETQQQTKG